MKHKTNESKRIGAISERWKDRNNFYVAISSVV